MNKIKENSFDAAPGGYSGISNVQPGLGTYASPSVSQNPEHFEGYLNYSKPDAQMVPQSGSLKKDIDQLYNKKDTPSPDEIILGIKEELNKMVIKDKALAKETVIKNLKKDPHFYSKLKGLNIDDKGLTINIQESKLSTSERTKMVLDKMIAEKNDTKPKPNQFLIKILNDKMEEKQERLKNSIQKSLLL